MYPQKNSSQEIGMAAPCFRKKDSNPPICGVHRVLLLPVTVAIDNNAPLLG
jgi:hypothetical protein